MAAPVAVSVTVPPPVPDTDDKEITGEDEPDALRVCASFVADTSATVSVHVPDEVIGDVPLTVIPVDPASPTDVTDPATVPGGTDQFPDASR